MPETSVTTETPVEQPTEAPASTSAPADAGPWYGSIEDTELKGWAENKKFETPADALGSYRNLEKLFGAEKAGRTVAIPGEKAEPQEWDDFYTRLGRPESPDKYEFQAPDNADAGFMDWFRKAAHENGLSAAAAKNLAEGYQKYASDYGENMSTQAQAAYQEQEAALRKEWGAAYDQKVAQGRAAAQQFGFTADEINAIENTIGYAGVLKRFADIGAKLGEGSMISGEGAQKGFDGALTPDGAKLRISELMSDKDWYGKYLTGSKAHLEQMDRLQKWAAGRG